MDSLFLAQQSPFLPPGILAQDLIKRLMYPGRDGILMHWDRSQHIHFTGLAFRVGSGNGLGLPYPRAPSLLQEHLITGVTSLERPVRNKYL